MSVMRPRTPLLVATVAVAFASCALLVTGAAAATTAASKDKIRTASLAGTSVWDAGGVTIGGTFSGTLGEGTYAGMLTFGPTWDFRYPECGPRCTLLTGAITFSTKQGAFTATLRPGNVAIGEDTASHSWLWFTSAPDYDARDVGLDLQVGGGTRAYAHATGQLRLAYASTWSHYWDSVNMVDVNEIVDAGTLTGDVRGAERAAHTGRGK